MYLPYLSFLFHFIILEKGVRNNGKLSIMIFEQKVPIGPAIAKNINVIRNILDKGMNKQLKIF